MSVHERFTPAERRLAVLLLALALSGLAIRWGRSVSPEVDAWLRDGVDALPPADSLGIPMDPAAGGRDSATGLVRIPAISAGLTPDLGKGTGNAIDPGAPMVDPNQAGLEALLELPGVGPVLGRRILEDREQHGPFRTPEDLLRVPGIGPATLARLRPYLSLGGPPTGSAQPSPPPVSWVSPPSESAVRGKASAPASSRKPPADI